MRNNPQAADCFYWLMSRAVLPYSDRIVRENVNVWKARKRRQTDRRPTGIRKNHERGPRCPENSVVPDPIHNRAHTMFANSETDISTLRCLAGEVASIPDVIQSRAMQICASAN